MLYLLPSWVAIIRPAPNLAAVIAVDVLLGWSTFGWLAALGMAYETYGPE
jgi:hypothetical protein